MDIENHKLSRLEIILISVIIGIVIIFSIMFINVKRELHNKNKIPKLQETVKIDQNLYKTTDGNLIFEERSDRLILIPQKDLRNITIQVRVYNSQYNFLNDYSVNFNQLYDQDIMSVYYYNDLRMPDEHFEKSKKISISYVD